MGDIEAKFFIPGGGVVIDLIEVKDHQITPLELRREIQRFRELFESNPTTYRTFTLTCTGVAPTIRPLLGALGRVRDPWGFYPSNSAVAQDSFQDFLRIAGKFFSPAAAQFLFDRVLVDIEPRSDIREGEQRFVASLSHALPEYVSVPLAATKSMFSALKALIDNHLNQAIDRRVLEKMLRENLAPDQRPALRPVQLHTMITNTDSLYPRAFRFEWSPFFGGEERNYPEPEIWNSQLLAELREVRSWVVAHRDTRRIRLTGNRRISTSLAIGSIFSAVAGFAMEMEQRGGEIWATDDHALANTPDYQLNADCIPGESEDLEVIMSIGREIQNEVKASHELLRLDQIAVLKLTSNQPILSAQHANLVVRKAKSHMVSAIEEGRYKRIHLFFAGPAFLGLLLGHRLNAVAPVQCYEWISSGRYAPTCLLYSGAA
jgi:hypothetical protein